MKINWLYIKVILLLCLSCNVSFSQDNGTYIDHTMITVPSAAREASSETLNFITPCGNFYVKDGKAWIKVDLGENYEFGNGNFGIPFNISMDLDIKILTTDASIDPAISFNVQLDNSKPESIIYLDLTQYIDKDNNSTGFTYLTNQIVGVEGTVSNVVNSSTLVDTATDIRVGLNYEINYGIDASTNTVNNLRYNVIPDSKSVVFQWDVSCDAPGYEFQMIRLYNRGSQTTEDQRIITTTIDWRKALSLYIDGAIPSIDLTMAEGQGYYAWRVRPVGTFYENGIGNDQNWGTWNALDYPVCSECEFNTTTGGNQVFFFTDPDDGLNFQYSRVFTENNKVSEQVTYATSLNQVRQTQRYIPSKDYKVVTQTILDNSGRPTLNTLPVPITGEKINRYKEGFVTASGGLYTARNFDDLDTYNNPAMIDATGAFEYYSSANADKRIPDAQGYPFTRVLFSNDGTDRVVEQSGVGKTHMIGTIADGKTRTTRTLYTTPTSDELVKLFGDEAPNHENVAKIITIDPNGTRSVSYITKEGNTIATGLTFSEDTDVLDSVKDTDIDTSSSIAGVMDRITNNIKTSDGFMASKRITILQDDTELAISYTIAQQILDGLCNDITFNLDYSLKIEVFDIDSGAVIHRFEEPTIENLTDTTNDDIDNITVDFGKITLDIGTYYIQKTLVPSDNIKLEITNVEDSLTKLIKPFFNWILDFSNRIDCEEEMQYLYNDIFHFGQLVFYERLAENISTVNGISTAIVNFNCDGCSQERIQFVGKDTNDPEADDEFLDYYIGNEDKYNITISYFDQDAILLPDEDPKLVPIDYQVETSLGTIKPIKVDFSTPCCEFAVPIVFTPPFRTPTPEALTAYMGGFREDEPDISLPTQVLESISYYNTDPEDPNAPLTSVNEDNWIQPNANFLFDDSKNFTYIQYDDDSVKLETTEAYPIDFEGYAISMLYECKGSGNANYSPEDAAEEVYTYMRGWHRPGLFNQMVYHMATDNYGGQECPRNEGGGGNSSSSGRRYEECDIESENVYLPGTSYTAQELADCWEPIVIEMINRLCIDAYDLDESAGGNVADRYDERTDGEQDTEGHLKDNIKNFIIRWISKPKLIKAMKRQNVNGNGGGDALDQATEELENMVNMFLKCTGYSFGDIIDENKEDPEANFGQFADDFGTRINSKTDEEYTVYDRNRLVNPDIPLDADDNMEWIYFSITGGSTGGYSVPTPEELLQPENTLEGRLAEFFPYIEDPVFAFKYFEYKDGNLPILEGETCFRDPNICIDEVTGEEFGCCGEDADGEPIPCNFCGVGYITCEETKNDWDCGQRFTFYSLLKDYSEEIVPGLGRITCENYYEADSYVINPDYAKDRAPYVLRFTDPVIPEGSLTDLEYLSLDLFNEYDPEGGYIDNGLNDLQLDGQKVFEPVTDLKNLLGETPGEGVSLVENDAYEMFKDCKENCETRRKEFEDALIEIFEERCYDIDGCKVDSNDNVVPIDDIKKLVGELVKQCVNQCEIDTFACVDETCRLLGAATLVDKANPTSLDRYKLDISFTDYGVSGPVVYRVDDPLTSRQDEIGEASQKLTYFNPQTGVTTETEELVLIEDVGSSGLKKYSFNNSNYNVKMWDIRQSLTYAQNTRWNQAKQWIINLDIPSKCDEDGIYNPDLTYNDQNLPNEDVYVPDPTSGIWVVQNFGICTDQEDYINRGNEDGTGDTFVERSDYIKETKEIYSTNPGSMESVESPKTGINLTIDPNN